jgi:hypothetical protein
MSASKINFCRNRNLIIAIAVSFAALVIVYWHEHQIAKGYQELARTVSSVASVTVYADGDSATGIASNRLSSVVSAQFPVEVFSTAAASAEYHYLPYFWKGAVHAVLTMRDGSQHRARFDLVWGMIKLEGVPGTYIVENGGGSEFAFTLNNIIQKQFISHHDGN